MEAERYLKCEAMLVAPDIFKEECANAIAKKVQWGDLQEENAWKYYEYLIFSDIVELIPSDEFIHI